MTASIPPHLSPLPLVGRAGELAMLRGVLDQAASGSGATVILCGESGIGKSRLLRAVVEDAERHGWSVAAGRAYPVETGVPYALFADALLPLLRRLSPEALAALTRGGEAELAYLFPMLQGAEATPRRPTDDPAELKTRLLWNFTQFLARLAARQPVLLVLDDLQWADASSLELLHFVARQIGGERIALLCSYNEAQRDQNPRLRIMEQSLVALDAARVHRVSPISLSDTAALIREAFGVEEAVTREFTALLFGWTRGNPFFLEEALKALVHSGRLFQRDGSWLGWGLEEIDLPRSIRDAVLHRISELSPSARAVADLLAVIGTSVQHEALRSVCDVPELEVLAAIDELRRHHLLEEWQDGGEVVYDFSHPVLRDTLYGELGLARARLLHARIAAALEELYGESALEHADRLAYHYARALTRNLAPKAIRYLAAAGRSALARYSDREAADYLGAALERARELGDESDPALLEDLARARQRLGEFDAAIQLWERALAAARQAGDPARAAGALRRIGLVYYWSGRYAQALQELDEGLRSAREAEDRALEVRIRLARAECWQEMGRPEDALGELEEALRIAEALGERELLARVHLFLLLQHTWTGPPEQAWTHGERALALAQDLGDVALSCTVHWALTVLAGLTGNPDATRRHSAECERLADLLRSPLHRLRAAEISIEFMSNTGEWDAAIALAERTLVSARAMNQRALLARLLVWTAAIYLGRGDIERGKQYVYEAWDLSGAERGDEPLDVHTVVPAHFGRAAYHVAVGDYYEAVRVGEAGLAIADRTGYTVWAIHRLLPVVAEAYLFAQDIEGATRVGARLRRDAERLGHQLGVAWADVCDAFLVWYRGDVATGIQQMRAAAERLESIPVIPDAARLRRQIAWRLRDLGQREEALRELRHAHEVFARLGAERELQKTREQIRELGARPPTRESASGAAGLSAREVEIVRLVAARKSNKTIAKLLDISPRTVSTHLSNIFRKLEVGSRGELADLAQQMDLSEA